ncbi:probable secreted beta-glucosidase SIM1 [Belonocnema kinseyi]|uniref:probable secreted beta-glucosidase SIM1 n=1 Tax=Belonocnema kinseyi TaxID=2817044 RepID=UPI00143D01C5|nr:probable secreted beta-glucosidase SIM1 [Belonocnema kinseyi]
MRAAIATLFINSAIFGYPIELISKSTRSNVDPACTDENSTSSLSYIPGLQIPRGQEIRHRREIIAVNQNNSIVPYIQNGAFTILKPKPKDVKNPDVIEFEAQHITDDEWLIQIAHWANEAKEGPWAVQSAVATVLRVHLAQVAATRSQNNILEQGLLLHHPDTSVDQQGLSSLEPPRQGFRMEQHERSKSFEHELSQLRIEPDEIDATSSSISAASSTSNRNSTSTRSSTSARSSISARSSVSARSSISARSSTSSSTSRPTNRSSSGSSKHLISPRLKMRDLRSLIKLSKSSTCNKK